MPVMETRAMELLVIDAQTRLVPAIDEGAARLAALARLLAAARRLDLPVLFTEQNPRGLGGTVPDLAREPGEVVAKMTFDAMRDADAREAMAGARDVIVCGFEAHVCVLQTALGLLARDRRVYVAADAVGSRRETDRQAALARLARHGAEIVTTEMAIFEWLGSAEHPAFRDLSALIR